MSAAKPVRVPSVENRLFSMRHNAALLAMLSLGMGNAETVLHADEQEDAWHKIGELCDEIRYHLLAVGAALDGAVQGQPAPDVPRPTIFGGE